MLKNKSKCGRKLSGSVDAVGDKCGDGRSVRPNVAHSSDVTGYISGVSPGEHVNQILREELGGSNATSTPLRTNWPSYSKSRTRVLAERDMPQCKSVRFDMGRRSRDFGGRELPRGYVTDASEIVPESLITSGAFSALEDIAQRQADARVVVA